MFVIAIQIQWGRYSGTQIYIAAGTARLNSLCSGRIVPVTWIGTSLNIHSYIKSHSSGSDKSDLHLIGTQVYGYCTLNLAPPEPRAGYTYSGYNIKNFRQIDYFGIRLNLPFLNNDHLGFIIVSPRTHVGGDQFRRVGRQLHSTGFTTSERHSEKPHLPKKKKKNHVNTVWRKTKREVSL